MREYLELLCHVLEKGTLKKNRTGVDTISTFNYNYSVDLRKGFPLLTTKKLNWKNILFENLWFLSGNSSPDFLHKHGITFWDAWLEQGRYQHWDNNLEKMIFDKSLPEAYGEYWRYYPGDDGCYDSVDQFRNIIEGLKKDPNNRRLVLTNWYPPSAWSAKLPPCHLMAIFNVQWEQGNEWIDTNTNKIVSYPIPVLNLHMTQRSCDVPVGVPYNIAGYAFILELVAHLTGIRVGKFAHTLIDAHIYTNQMDGVEDQLIRKPTELPNLVISPDLKTLEDLDSLIREGTTEQIMKTFEIIGYEPQPFIKFPVAV